MALTATFAADFDKFESSLKSAKFQIQAFDRATTNSMRSLKRETETFSGQKVAIEAARMAEAVKRLGGDAGVGAGLLKLLPEELKRVSAAMETAAAKASLLGEKLPPSLQKVRDEIAKLPPAAGAAGGGLTGLFGAFTKLGPLIGVTSFVGAATGIARLGSSAIDSAGKVTDLAGSLGVSTDAIQEMQAVAKQIDGASVEVFASSVFRLGLNLEDTGAKGDKAKRALDELGLSFTQIKRLSPEQQFRDVIRALEGVDDVQKRNSLGVALFGKQFEQMSKAVAQGYTSIADATTKTSEDQLKALDAAGDAWTKFVDDLGKEVQRALGTLVILGKGLRDAMDLPGGGGRSGSLVIFSPGEQRQLADLQAAGKTYQDAVDQILRARQRMVDIKLPNETPTIPKDYVAALAEIDARLKALSPDQVKQLNAAITIGEEEAKKYANTLKIGEDGLDRFKDLARAAATEATKFSKSMEDSIIWGEGIHGLATWMEDLAEASRALELPKTEPITKIFEMGPDIWMDEFQTWLDMRSRALRNFHDDHAKDITKIFDFGPDSGIAIFQAGLDKAAKSIKGTFVAAFKDLPNVIMRALEGGGDLFKSIGALFGSKIFGEESDLVKSATGWLSKAMGGFGKLLGSMIPGLGTLLGAGLGGLFDKLFGGEGKKVNDLRDQFTSAAGGIDELAKHAAAAGLTLKNFYAADTVKEYEAAIRELEDAFKDLERNRATAGAIFDDLMRLGEQGIPDFIQPHINQLIELGLLTDEQADKLRVLANVGATNWDKVREAAAAYGVRVESLGSAFQAQRIGADAAGIINAFETIVNAHGDVGGVLFDMQDEITALVKEAKKFNIPLPANLKPLVDELSRAGLLTEDLTGIQFGEAIETEAEKTRKAFEGITEEIRELIRTLNQIPSSVGIGVGSGVPSASPGMPTGTPTESAVASIMAGSGASRATFHVPVELDGRVIADVVINQLGNRLAVRGAR